MVTFVCVNAGNYLGKGTEYVNILHDMVIRNLPAGFEGKFICFTDTPEGLNPGIETRELHGQLHGWWNKLYLFKKGVLPGGERIIYLDLDTVITGPLDDIVKYNSDFAILRDFYYAHGLGSGVMMWHGDHSRIWDSWVKAGMPQINGGDQGWIQLHVKNPDILQELYPQSFVSYKAHAKKMFPKGAKVVCFHGEPRPHDAGGWVPFIWKIGGGSSYEQVCQGNTEDGVLIDQIRHAITLPYPLLQRVEPHDGIAAVVGGGPSLKTSYIHPEHTIFATNNAWRSIPKFDYHVMLDARKENAEFVPDTGKKLYASQCHPDVFKGDVTIWHSYADGIQEIIADDPRETVFVGGGSSVGLKAIVIAFLMGFRKIHVYGLDSSYEDGKHHAYSQSLNDGERIINVTCNDKEYQTAPWMVTQCDEFKELAVLLIAEGCELVIHGYGLLPDIAKAMSQPCEIHWPKGDVEAHHYAPKELNNIKAILEFVEGRDTVIQAGGAIGLWPREYAKHFKQVYSFEPDTVNYECFVKNCIEPNVNVRQFALGDENKKISIQRQERNLGASHVTEGDSVDMVRLDDLAFEGCDLLQLDIEGYELFALKGAENLIKKFKPVICLEFNTCATRYGYDFEELTDYLATLGYRLIEKLASDYVFKFDSNS